MSLNNARVVVAAVLIAVVVVGGHLLPGLNNSLVEHGIRDSLHLLVFAVFAIIIYQGLQRSRAFSGIIKPALLSLVVVVVVGGLSEFVQYLAGRQPDIYDVIRDASGAALVLTCVLLCRWSQGFGRSTAAIIAARFAAVVAGVCIVVPLAFWLTIIAMGRVASPVILDFSQWWQPYIYRPINAEIAVSASKPGIAEVHLLKWSHSGLVVSPLTTNWVDYQFLSITAGMLKGAETNVTVRINDGERVNDWSDEFNQAIVVVPETATWRIPLHELIEEAGYVPMDLSDIQEVVIFARDSRGDTVMLIEDIRLD